jgi:hypothetical protein
LGPTPNSTRCSARQIGDGDVKPARLKGQAPQLPRPGLARPDDEDNDPDGGTQRDDLGKRGALGGTRTPNLLIRSQMLYPLSYERQMAQLVYGTA